MSTPKHCPGFTQIKNLQSFSCGCPECGFEVEIFSDEFDRTHVCKRCKVEIDFSLCAFEGDRRA